MHREAVFWTFVLAVSAVKAGSMGDQCDWTGRYVFYKLVSNIM